MGKIADAMINGELCAGCGVYLEPKEKVFTDDNKPCRMPKDGSPMGFPVYCASCHSNQTED